MKNKHFFIFLLLISLTTTVAKSQDCLEKLYRANKLLDAGNAQGCIALAAPCSDKANDNSVRWQAYRLMSIAYLLQGHADSSKIAAENMLDLNPTYKPNLLKDSKEFINQLKSIVVIPKFTLGLAFSVGANINFVNIPKSYIVSDYQKTYNTQKNSYQLGTNVDFYLNPKLALEMGLYITGKKYAIDYSFSNWKVNVNERLNYLEIPITAKYIFNSKSRTRIFAQGGLYGGNLLFAYNDFESNYNNSEQVFKLTNLNSMDRRNKWNVGFTGGIGAFYQVRDGHLSLQANYYHSLSKINDASTRYSYNDQIYTYYYVDDDIILHNLAISFGFCRNLNYKVYRSKN